MNDTKASFDIEGHDIAVAFSLLSRLPIPVNHERAGKRGSKAAWAYPLVGAGIGAMAGLVGVVSGWFGAPSGMLAALILGILVLGSGAMHEDGLADFTDGVGGANDKARILEIMRDSRIGAYGAIILVITLLARWSGIAGISGAYALILGLAAIAATSRAVMVAAMFAMPNASDKGMSASAGRPDQTSVLLALAIALVLAVLAAGLAGAFLIPLAMLGATPVYWLAMRKLGGQTGDVLGAIQQSAEITALAAFITILA